MDAFFEYNVKNIYAGESQMTKDQIKNTIYGVAIGDATGCPVQFFRREQVKALKITDMIGHGVYNKPEGTWTDDTSMTLALADSIGSLGKVDYEDIMKNFVKWLYKAGFTTEKKSFDIGRGCYRAIVNFKDGISPVDCGGKDYADNGNGSLMRISPIVFYLISKFGENYLDDEAATDQAFEIVSNVSSLTHAHPVARFGCIVYCALLTGVLNGIKKDELRQKIFPVIGSYVRRHPEYQDAVEVYDRIFHLIPGNNFAELPEEEIKSSGFVLDTLESAIWCFYNSENYRDCILKAVNLGGDTDSIAAIAGALAGPYYGELPEDWVKTVRGKKLLDDAVEKLSEAFLNGEKE